MPMSESKAICKTILRNGYDAYLINTALQNEINALLNIQEFSIACDVDAETLQKLFPNLDESEEPGELAVLKGESGCIFRFYPINCSADAHPEALRKFFTQRMVTQLKKYNPELYEAVVSTENFMRSDEVFADFSCGYIKLQGIPHLTLNKNYVLAIRALRFAANYDLPIDPNTWVAIVKNASNIVNYISGHAFVEEWRLVSAESMWRFFELLKESSILHGIIPELGALTAVKQHTNKKTNDEESVFDFTIRCLKYYPEELLHYDWVGAVAVLFHAIGKAYAAERVDDRWYFTQFHRIGAKITRKILYRMHFESDDIDTICAIIGNQIRFQSMMTDRGMQKFLELPHQERLIELARAQIKAIPNGNYTNFNHNIKFMERGTTPLSMREPLLNGNEIMEYTNLAPGPKVGRLREALLNAQVIGEVKNTEEAIRFVIENMDKIPD
ncbi:HD family phosphohydrolase [Taurinivorans muris]|uniref:HD family phosphohydrolase n=1 Tax=Taurinivorans muris TaxID=2787751 RepID=A0ABY5Y471_9BACT|nr:HD family phosphohydrolase [Desulfovibrionaceae bacterium LT0009]